MPLISLGTDDAHAGRCDAARDGQILVSERVHAAVEEIVVAEELAALTLKGFSRAVTARNVVGLADTT